MRTYCLVMEVRRERRRKRSELIAKAPPARPARINVGFSGESSQPPKPSPVCARAGRATIKARASATKRNLSFIATPMRSTATVYRLLESIHNRESFHGFERCASKDTTPTNTAKIIRRRLGEVNAIIGSGGFTGRLARWVPAYVKPLSTVACGRLR